jgi:capsular polysaccharide biosynthesis protein
MRTRIWVGVAAGLAVAMAVVAVGAVFAMSRAPEWTAETKLLVGPGERADPTNISAYYETLSRGQVTATAAEIIGEPRFLRSAVRQMPVEDVGAATARVTVVPGTSLVSVSVTARMPGTAEALADDIARESTPTVSRLLAPYAATSLGSATGSATRSGLSVSQLVAVIALVAVVAGVGVQQLVQQVSNPRQRVRRARP